MLDGLVTVSTDTRPWDDSMIHNAHVPNIHATGERNMRTRSIRLTSLAVTISVAAFLMACGGSSDDPTSAPATLTVAPSPTATSSPVGSSGDLSSRVQVNPNNGGQHLAPGVRGSGYTERPATSGPHWFAPDTPSSVPAPARWGIYNFALTDEILVHNLEHGGVGIHYACSGGCPELVAQLEALVTRDQSQFIMSPYPGMETRIAITAWRRHLYLDESDGALIREFIDRYQDTAPESVKGNSF